MRAARRDLATREELEGVCVRSSLGLDEHRATGGGEEGGQGGSTVPVPNAEVSLGVYRASTDESGRAILAVAPGSYELLIWKVGYEAPARALEVSKDLTVRVEAADLHLSERSSWEDD